MDGASIVQKELNETIVRSREEIEERLETEDRQQLGDISDEVYPRDTPTSKFHLRVPWICTRTVCVCVCARTFLPPPASPPPLLPRAAKRSAKRLLSSSQGSSHATLESTTYRSLSVSLCLFLCFSWKAALPFLFPGRAAKISSCFRPRLTLDDLCLPFVASVKNLRTTTVSFKVCREARLSLEEWRNVFEKTRWSI